MSVLLGLACEDKGHFSAVTCLVDHMLLTHYDWLEGILDDCRAWRGVKESEFWYKYSPDDANVLRPVTIGGHRIKLHGPIRGEPLKPEASMWRRVLLLFCQAIPRPEVVILARDIDGYPNRRGGIDQVRRGLPWPFKVVVATPQPEIEAWHVSGFIPATPTEQKRLKTLESELSFDPTTQSHRLTSHPNDASTDAKRILERLCDSDVERAEACLKDRATLHQRGALNGARDFLEEVSNDIAPLLARAR